MPPSPMSTGDGVQVQRETDARSGARAAQESADLAESRERQRRLPEVEDVRTPA